MSNNNDKDDNSVSVRIPQVTTSVRTDTLRLEVVEELFLNPYSRKVGTLLITM